jgi:hypothetical protein
VGTRPIPTPAALARAALRGLASALGAAARWCAAAVDRSAYGAKGLRDADDPCPFYDPAPARAGDLDDCLGDGHHLCRRCRHLDAVSRRERGGVS